MVVYSPLGPRNVWYCDLSPRLTLGQTRGHTFFQQYIMLHYTVPSSVGDKCFLIKPLSTVRWVLALSDSTICYDAWPQDESDDHLLYRDITQHISTLKSRGATGEEIAVIPERIVPKLGGDLEKLHGGILGMTVFQRGQTTTTTTYTARPPLIW